MAPHVQSLCALVCAIAVSACDEQSVAQRTAYSFHDFNTAICPTYYDQGTSDGRAVFSCEVRGLSPAESSLGWPRWLFARAPALERQGLILTAPTNRLRLWVDSRHLGGRADIHSVNVEGGSVALENEPCFAGCVNVFSGPVEHDGLGHARASPLALPDNAFSPGPWALQTSDAPFSSESFGYPPGNNSVHDGKLVILALGAFVGIRGYGVMQGDQLVAAVYLRPDAEVQHRPLTAEEIAALAIVGVGYPCSIACQDHAQGRALARVLVQRGELPTTLLKYADEEQLP